jgi:hypothetical protein
MYYGGHLHDMRMYSYLEDTIEDVGTHLEELSPSLEHFYLTRVVVPTFEARYWLGS